MGQSRFTSKTSSNCWPECLCCPWCRGWRVQVIHTDERNNADRTQWMQKMCRFIEGMSKECILCWNSSFHWTSGLPPAHCICAPYVLAMVCAATSQGQQQHNGISFSTKSRHSLFFNYIIHNIKTTSVLIYLWEAYWIRFRLFSRHAH